jgi:hypothetical protein
MDAEQDAQLALLAERFPRATERGYRFVAAHRDRFSRLAGADACQVCP